MNTQAYFDDIQQHIAKELQKARHSIYIVVAWFTDKYLFSTLCDKAKTGIEIELILMDDSINKASGIDYERLARAGGKLWWIPTGSERDRLMHNKFCVMDEEKIINGSYNWINKAHQNHESITVIQDKELALQFVNEFYTIKQHYFGGQSEKMVDNVKLCIRLEALKNVILLEDEEDISYQVLKLKKVLPAHDEQFLAVRQIVRETELKHYGSVVAQINEYVSKQRAISIYVDTEITAMHLEVKMLGLQISSLEDEKTEIEKMLYLFKLRHDRELGGLIVELLKLRHGKLKEKAKQDDKKRKEAEEAERDYSEYQKSYEESSLKKIAPLNETEEIELKIKFRKATKLCHPDVVNESQKEHAEIVFRALKEAYDNNNVQKIRDILSDLEQGVFAERSETISEKTELQAMVMQLRRRRDELEHALVELKKSETYRTVSQIDNWDNYFEDIKKQLEKDLEGIKEEK